MGTRKEVWPAASTVDEVDTNRLEFRYDRWCGWLLGLLGSGRRFSHVTLHDDKIVVHLGWAFRAAVPRASIVRARPSNDRVWGWGAHGWGGRWLVNGSSHGLVTLDIEPVERGRVCGFPVKLHQLTISLVDPEALLSYVNLERST